MNFPLKKKVSPVSLMLRLNLGILNFIIFFPFTIETVNFVDSYLSTKFAWTSFIDRSIDLLEGTNEGLGPGGCDPQWQMAPWAFVSEYMCAFYMVEFGFLSEFYLVFA